MGSVYEAEVIGETQHDESQELRTYVIDARNWGEQTVGVDEDRVRARARQLAREEGLIPQSVSVRKVRTIQRCPHCDSPVTEDSLRQPPQRFSSE